MTTPTPTGPVGDVDQIKSALTAALMVLEKIPAGVAVESVAARTGAYRRGPVFTFASAVDAARLAHDLGLPPPVDLYAVATTRSSWYRVSTDPHPGRAVWSWTGVWADSPIHLLGSGRAWTPNTTDTDANGQTVTRIHVHRYCDACDTELGDVQSDELAAATAGRHLPDVRRECPVCVTTHGHRGRPPTPVEARCEEMLTRLDDTGVVVVTPDNADQVRHVLLAHRADVTYPAPPGTTVPDQT